MPVGFPERGDGEAAVEGRSGAPASARCAGPRTSLIPGDAPPGSPNQMLPGAALRRLRGTRNGFGEGNFMSSAGHAPWEAGARVCPRWAVRGPRSRPAVSL